MKIYILFLFTILAGTMVKAQQNFTFQPAHPKPGDTITIQYKPAGDLANIKEKVEAVFYLHNKDGYRLKADDLPLTKVGNSYTASVCADTSFNLIQLGFYVDKTFDNNFDQGYTIQLWNGDTVSKGSFASLSNFYSESGHRTGVITDFPKAHAMMEKEKSLFPDDFRTYEWRYYYVLSKIKKDTILPLIENEVEKAMKAGLTTEHDYQRVAMLYDQAKLDGQSNFFYHLRNEKFPEGQWRIQSDIGRITSERNPARAMALYFKIENNPASKAITWDKSFFRRAILQGYLNNSQWDTLKKFEYNPVFRLDLASIYNEQAWNLQEQNKDLNKAEELSAWATALSKKEVDSPTQSKPYNLTTKEWNRNRQNLYSMYADTYAMVEYKLGNFTRGFPYAEEASITINKGQDADQNNTYALLAEKVLKPSVCMEKLSQFVRDRNATDSVKAVLKRAYIAINGSGVGYSRFIADLEKETILQMEAEVKKSMISQSAPVFKLKTMTGEEVDLEQLKGKVVILDFWATWCGPCRASLPSMQKEVKNYQSNPDVQFFFIDSWEHGEYPEKLKRTQDFIAGNKYDFTVLMDNDNAVIKKYNVEGIPTKFVIDKNGLIRFKTVGFDNANKLQNEIEVMIGICLQQ